VQKRGADRRFLEKALKSGKAVYSLHKGTRDRAGLKGKTEARRGETAQVLSATFLKRFIEKNGGQVKAVYPLVMNIPHMFDFHTKKKHEFRVDLYVIERR